MFGLSHEQLMRSYEHVVCIRFFEDRVRHDICPYGLIRGCAHLYIGEETVAQASNDGVRNSGAS